MSIATPLEAKTPTSHAGLSLRVPHREVIDAALGATGGWGRLSYGMMMRGGSGCAAVGAGPPALPGVAMALAAALLRRGKRARRNSRKARERGRLLDSALFMRRRKTKSWKISESFSEENPVCAASAWRNSCRKRWISL